MANHSYGPSGAPVWCSPTIDAKRGLVYIGTGENYTCPTTNTSDAIQAIDMNTGKLVWNFQATSDDAYNVACPVFINCPDKSGPDLDFGMAPILDKETGRKEYFSCRPKIRRGICFITKRRKADLADKDRKRRHAGWHPLGNGY